MIVKRIGPVSCAKLSGFLYAVIGLIIGGVFSLFAMAGGFVSDAPEFESFAPIFGVTAVIVFPILYGCMGFVATLIMAWLYNVAAGIVGGVELDIQ